MYVKEPISEDILLERLREVTRKKKAMIEKPKDWEVVSEHYKEILDFLKEKYPEKFI